MPGLRARPVRRSRPVSRDGKTLEPLEAHGLVLDALVRPMHLPRLGRFIARFPRLRVVIDHGAKPRIGELPGRGVAEPKIATAPSSDARFAATVRAS